MANSTRTQLSTDSLSLFPDNTSQLITPADLRNWITSGIESFVTQKDKSTFENAFYECQSSPITATSGTTNLALATGNFVHITGSGSISITSFGLLPPGSRFVLCFDIAVTLVYNATSMILPGAANIVTAPGDSVMIISEGGGNWRLIGFFPSSGLPVGTVTAVTASAPLSSTGSNAPDISISKADATTDGYLDSGDFATFSGKQDALTLTTTGSGLATLVGSTLNIPPGGTGTVISVGTSSPLTGGPITGLGTIGIQDAAADGSTKGAATFNASDFNSASGVISIDYANGQEANASQDGFLSKGDWSAFNGKQDALVSGTNIKTVNSNSLLGSGNVSVGTVTSIVAGTGLNGGTITGSGTIDLANTTVTPGAYTNTNITVDAQGRITAASNGSGGGGGSPGGANGDYQYKNGSAFAGDSKLKFQSSFVVAQTPKIGDSTTTGHFHMHRVGTAPTGIVDYLTMFWDRTLRAIGFRHENESFVSQIQFTQPTADRTYTLPDATGNVVVDTVLPVLNNGLAEGQIRLREAVASGSNYIGIKSPATLAADYTLTLPNTNPASGQVMVSDGSGNLSWTSNPGSIASGFLNTFGGSFTGTTAETLLQALLVPANTFTSSRGIKIQAIFSRTNAAFNAITGARILINTSPVIGGTNITGVTYAQASTPANLTSLIRSLFIQVPSGSPVSIYAATGVSSAATNEAGGYTLTTAPINWAVDQYVILAVSQNQAAQTVTCNALSISPQ